MTPGANDLCVFATKRGNVKKRLDVEYCYKDISINLHSVYSIIDFGSIIECIYRYPTFYGIEYVNNGIGVIKGENISREGEWIKLDSIKYIDEETNCRFSRTVLEKDDLVMTVRGEVGKTAIVNEELKGCNITGNVIRIKLKQAYGEKKIDPYYIFEYLNSDIGKTLIKKQTTGGVQETITVEGISNIDIILPDYHSQVHFVDDMRREKEKYDQKRSYARELLIQQTEFLLAKYEIIPSPLTHIDNGNKDSSVFYSAVRVGEIINNQNWGVEYYHPERMAALLALKQSSKAKKQSLCELVRFRKELSNAYSSNLKYLGLAGVESTTGELSGAQEVAKGQAYSYYTNDVLYGKLRPYLNKVLLAETSGICSTEFHVMCIKEQGIILPEYLAAIMRSRLILAQTKHMMTGNTHPRISNEDVKNLCIPVPDLDIQNNIVKELQSYRIKARRLRLEAEEGWTKAKLHFIRKLLEE